MSIQVAIVDDDLEVLDGISRLLGKHGDEFSCTVFGDAEAFASFQMIERFDVVLMDIELPGMSGIECTRAIKSNEAAPEIMMLTMFRDDDRVFESLQAGATGYLLKSASGDRIVTSIRELNSGGSPMSPEIARQVMLSFRSDTSESKDLSKLTPREREILQRLAEGLLYKEIADRLSISPFTVRAHIHNIYEKLQVHTKVDAINKLRGR